MAQDRCPPPPEQIAWSFVNRMNERYGPLTNTQRQYTVNRNGQRDPNGGFIRENGELVLVQPIKEWRQEHLRYVDYADLQGLMVLAAGERYRTLGEITPRGFTPESFGSAILNEWQRRGYQVNPRFRPGYIGVGPDGQPQFCPTTPSQLRPIVPGIGGMAFNDLTPNARPDSEHDLVSPNVLARADRVVRDLKSSVVLAA